MPCGCVEALDTCAFVVGGSVASRTQRPQRTSQQQVHGSGDTTLHTWSGLGREGKVQLVEAIDVEVSVCKVSSGEKKGRTRYILARCYFLLWSTCGCTCATRPHRNMPRTVGAEPQFESVHCVGCHRDGQSGLKRKYDGAVHAALVTAGRVRETNLLAVELQRHLVIVWQFQFAHTAELKAEQSSHGANSDRGSRRANLGVVVSAAAIAAFLYVVTDGRAVLRDDPGVAVQVASIGGHPGEVGGEQVDAVASLARLNGRALVAASPAVRWVGGQLFALTAALGLACAGLGKQRDREVKYELEAGALVWQRPACSALPL